MEYNDDPWSPQLDKIIELLIELNNNLEALTESVIPVGKVARDKKRFNNDSLRKTGRK